MGYSLHPSVPISQVTIFELQTQEAEGQGDACRGRRRGATPLNEKKTLPTLTAGILFAPCLNLPAHELQGRGAACRGAQGGATPWNEEQNWQYWTSSVLAALPLAVVRLLHYWFSPKCATVGFALVALTTS
jgi:hypothetical protein